MTISACEARASVAEVWSRCPELGEKGVTWLWLPQKYSLLGAERTRVCRGSWGWGGER